MAGRGTPSMLISYLVVLTSMLTGASVVHNIYKPDLTIPQVEPPKEYTQDDAEPSSGCRLLMDRKSRDKDPRSVKVKLAAIRREYNELFKDTVARSTQLQELKKSRQLLQAEVSFLRKRVRLLSQSSPAGETADVKVTDNSGDDKLPAISDDQEILESQGQEEGDPSSNGLNGYDEYADEPDEPEAMEPAGMAEAGDSSSEEISGFTMSRSGSPPLDDFATGDSQEYAGKDPEDEADSASASDDDLEVYAQDSDRSS